MDPEEATFVIRAHDNLIAARTGARWEVLAVTGLSEDDPDARVILVGSHLRVVPVPAIELFRNIANGNIRHIPFGRDSHPPLAIGGDPFTFVSAS